MATQPPSSPSSNWRGILRSAFSRFSKQPVPVRVAIVGSASTIIGALIVALWSSPTTTINFFLSSTPLGAPPTPVATPSPVPATITSPRTFADLTAANLFYQHSNVVDITSDAIALRGSFSQGIWLKDKLPENFRASITFRVLHSESDMYVGLSKSVGSVYPSCLLRVDNNIYSLLRMYRNEGKHEDTYFTREGMEAPMETTRSYVIVFERQHRQLQAHYVDDSGNEVRSGGITDESQPLDPNKRPTVIDPIDTLNYFYIASNTPEQRSTGIMITDFFLQPLP